MAFGETATKLSQKTAQRSTPTDEIIESQWMPTGSGNRLFYILPKLGNDGKIVMTERKSSNGKPIKRDGQIQLGLEPADEVVFAFAWWQVMVNGAPASRRIMLDPTKRYNNPLWDLIDSTYPSAGKGQPQPRERSTIKLGFALNVWDTSPVMRNDAGVLFYQSESGNFDRMAYMNNGKIETDKEKLPKNYDNPEYATPLNAVRVLEGSYGKEGGKHLFQDLLDLVGTIENADGLILRLPEFQLRLRTVGEKLETKRTIRATSNFRLPTEAFYQPRYDLVNWTKPWPDEAVIRLLEGEDYAFILEEYQLTSFPKLMDVTTATATTSEPLFD